MRLTIRPSLIFFWSSAKSFIFCLRSAMIVFPLPACIFSMRAIFASTAAAFAYCAYSHFCFASSTVSAARALRKEARLLRSATAWSRYWIASSIDLFASTAAALAYCAYSHFCFASSAVFAARALRKEARLCRSATTWSRYWRASSIDLFFSWAYKRSSCAAFSSRWSLIARSRRS